MDIDILKPCPCGTGINFETCCQPHLLGLEKARTAEKLLRSRYSAFVAGQIDYIVDTHHPETVKDLDRDGISDWSKKSTWHGLEIVRTENGAESDDEGLIEFRAKYAQDGKMQNHHETSVFKKHEGAWYFYDVVKNQTVKKEVLPGRNDPCLCGSGKKYKKCCLKAA